MKFFAVGSKPKESTKDKPDYTPAIVQQTHNALYSIGEGVRQGYFGYDTLQGAIKSIRAYQSKYLLPYVDGEILVDSGGYEYLKEKKSIPPDATGKLIDANLAYMKSEKDVYSNIFSVDIGLTLNPKYSYANNKEFITYINGLSLEKTKKILIEYPEIAKKWIFIYQWKIWDIFKIFEGLYKELNLAEVVNNWAIGGLVSIRNICPHIDYSSFIPMSFRILYDYLSANRFDHDLRIHILGIGNVVYDRFAILILEKLFQRYLMSYSNTSTRLTFDSVQQTHRAMKGALILGIYYLNNDVLEYAPRILDVPDEIVKKVYTGPNFDLYDAIKENFGILEARIRTRSKKIKHADMSCYGALNIFSNLEIDRYLEKMVDHYGLIDSFFRYDGIENFIEDITKKLACIQESCWDLFTDSMIESIKKNFAIIFHYHKIIINNPLDYEGLNSNLERFIKNALKFPAVLN